MREYTGFSSENRPGGEIPFKFLCATYRKGVAFVVK